MTSFEVTGSKVELELECEGVLAGDLQLLVFFFNKHGQQKATYEPTHPGHSDDPVKFTSSGATIMIDRVSSDSRNHAVYICTAGFAARNLASTLKSLTLTMKGTQVNEVNYTNGGEVPDFSGILLCEIVKEKSTWRATPTSLPFTGRNSFGVVRFISAMLINRDRGKSEVPRRMIETSVLDTPSGRRKSGSHSFSHAPTSRSPLSRAVPVPAPECECKAELIALRAELELLKSTLVGHMQAHMPVQHDKEATNISGTENIVKDPSSSPTHLEPAVPHQHEKAVTDDNVVKDPISPPRSPGAAPYVDSSSDDGEVFMQGRARTLSSGSVVIVDACNLSGSLDNLHASVLHTRVDKVEEAVNVYRDVIVRTTKELKQQQALLERQLASQPAQDLPPAVLNIVTSVSKSTAATTHILEGVGSQLSEQRTLIMLQDKNIKDLERHIMDTERVTHRQDAALDYLQAQLDILNRARAETEKEVAADQRFRALTGSLSNRSEETSPTPLRGPSDRAPRRPSPQTSRPTMRKSRSAIVLGSNEWHGCLTDKCMSPGYLVQDNGKCVKCNDALRGESLAHAKARSRPSSARADGSKPPRRNLQQHTAVIVKKPKRDRGPTF